MPIWTPHHQHDSLGSTLDGGSSPEKMVKRCKELGYNSCTLTNHGSLASVVKLELACKKNEMKPIRGCEFYLTKDASVKDHKNRKLSHLCILAKNKIGWTKLVQALNRANQEDLFYYKPRLDLDILSKYCDGNLIGFSGHPGSDLGNVIFTTMEAYRAKTYEEAKEFIKENWVEETEALALKYRDIFGKENFFLEIQLIDQDNLPAQQVIAKALRFISKKTGIPCLGTADSHYATKADAIDQRLLLATALQTSLRQINLKLTNEEDFGLDTFFKSNQYHIPSQEEMANLHTKEELDNALLIEEMCEQFSILRKPQLPKFGDNPVQHLREACREGWKDKIEGIVNKEQYDIYSERVKHELGVIEKVGLSDYFLIVRDFIKYANVNGITTGVGRGSGAGSLVTYLSDITRVDPIRFGLIFERFYNEGRNTENSIKLPDLDIDFPANKRAIVLDYVREKYGQTQVAQICTFGRMMGRGAIKDVFRAHESCSFDEMNRITEHIPDEAKIADDLEEMRKEGEIPSIILWALQNNGDKLKEWAYLEDGEIKGPLASQFAQAIRIEGTPRSTGKHASGVIITNMNLYESVPMIRDKSSNELIVGLELDDAEASGLPKFDFLSLSLIDRLETVERIINGYA